MLSNLKSALQSIASNKVRSVLTVLGVVIGVASVTTLISLGEGLKNDVSGLIQGFGTNVITVISGKIDTSTTGGQQSANPANFVAGDILSLSDVEKLQAIPEITAVSPLSPVTGSLKYEDKVAAPTILGAYPVVTQAFQILEIDKGQMFASTTSGNVIVLSPSTATGLFGEVNPIGKKIKLGDRELEVAGVFAKAKSSSIFGSEFDSISIIPFDTATSINKDQVKIMRIVARANDSANIDTVKETMKSTLLANHDMEENFTVLTQDDLLGLFNTFLNLATTMVSAIAAISLVVGGIGIMNIMLVTVTERTREIGLRKAVGATKLAILIQFLTEAIMVTLVGSLIGLAISFATGALIRNYSDLEPQITGDIILVAVGISVIIGVIFGLWPALRAANKDPIHALRYE